jgi:hypothetical protein
VALCTLHICAVLVQRVRQNTYFMGVGTKLSCRERSEKEQDRAIEAHTSYMRTYMRGDQSALDGLIFLVTCSPDMQHGYTRTLTRTHFILSAVRAWAAGIKARAGARTERGGERDVQPRQRLNVGLRARRQVFKGAVEDRRHTHTR